jgi:1-acyl-sn-glycerol-3-phosphate acyltransferase
MIAEAIAGFARFLAGTSVFWTDGPPDEGQRVYFANHTSHLDFAVLWSALPSEVRGRTRPIAARDYWEKGALKRFLSSAVFHAVLVDRLGGQGGGREESAESAERAAAARRTIDTILSEIGDRDSLIVFPEGTRGTGRIPGPFKSGLYHLCRARPDLEAMPVYLDNMNRILPKGESLPVPMLSRAIFGRSMKILPGEGKTEFLGRARDAVIALERL